MSGYWSKSLGVGHFERQFQGGMGVTHRLMAPENWAIMWRCLSQGRSHGIDMSTSLLPEGVPEIDAYLFSLDGRCGEWER